MSRACCCCCKPRVEKECFKAPVVQTHEVCWYKTPVIHPICGGGVYGAGAYGTEKGCICSLPTLVILILIILQFGKKSHYDDEDEGSYKSAGIDNGILFIIAIFYLICGNTCK